MIAVVDYGAGNTRSVLRALEAVGADARLSSTAEGLDASERLVVPGVGAAPSAVEALASRGLWEPVRRWGAAGRPFLGVCLGAQLLLGLGRGRRARVGSHRWSMPCLSLPADGGPRQVPHIGWNEVRTAGGSFDAYFVHGYWTDAAADAVAGRTTVDGFTFPSLLRRGAMTGTQFHPEKSGPVGRALLAAFASGRLDATVAAASSWS